MAGVRLWLVRHGETDWNARGRIQGHTPTELNEGGRRQAAGLAAIFAGRTFAAVWSSDLPRAYQTAEVIAAALGLEVEKTDKLRERCFGEFEGKTNEEMRALRLKMGLNVTSDLTDWTGVPGVESNAVLWERVGAELRRLAAKYSGESSSADVMVVTHGGVIARAVYRVLGIEDSQPRRFSLANGIVAVLEWRESEFWLLSLADMGLVMGRAASADTAMAQ